MATPLTIENDRRDDGTLVLRASGEIDMSNIDAFSTHSTMRLARHRRMARC